MPVTFRQVSWAAPVRGRSCHVAGRSPRASCPRGHARRQGWLHWHPQTLAWIIIPAVVAATVSAAPPTVAILPPVLPFDVSRHARKAEGLLELVQVAMNDGAVAFVERQKIARILAEQRLMMALGAEGAVAWGRGLGADLLVLPEVVPLPDEGAGAPAAAVGPGWTVRLTVIDPEKASVMSATEVAARGDRENGPTSLDIERAAADLTGRLVADAKAEET